MPSIYQRISEEFAKTRRLPYSFMPQEIGANGLRAMLGNGLPPDFQILCARRAWSAAFGDGKWSIVEPLWFAGAFRREAQQRISEGEISLEEAVAQGRRMATGSDRADAVEIGMLLMGLKKDDLVEQVMERLALHSRFTLVAVEACRDWPDQNARLFRWMQNTCDCGTVICALALKPENDFQRKWLFENGMRVGKPQSEMAKCILDRPSMEEYIRSLPDTAENFHALCRLVAYVPDPEPRQVTWLALKMLQGLEFADSYIDLCAMHRMQRVLLTPEHELYEQWAQKCDPQRWKLRSRGVIEREMDSPREGAGLLSLVLTGEGILPPLERLKPVLASQELPQAMLRFLLLYHTSRYAEELLDMLMQVAPPAVFEEEPSVRDPREYPGGMYDIWLAAALGAMSGSGMLREEDVLQCLQARSAMLRHAAVDCLEVMSNDGLSDTAEKALQTAIEREPDRFLKDRMQRQQHGVNPSSRRRFVLPVAEGMDVVALEHAQLHGALGSAPLLSRESYNCDGLRNLLPVDSRLLLAQDEQDPDYAYVMTPGGIVLGEVELAACPDAKPLLINGMTIVAEIKDTLYAEQPSVVLYLMERMPVCPARQEDCDKIRPFPFRR